MTKAKRWIGFLVAAVILQGIMLLFCTEAGLMRLYPLLVRVNDEQFQTRGAYSVYYDMRLPLTAADCIAVGVDFSVTQSYDTFGHLFRFLKQYRNVKTIHIAHPAAEDIASWMTAMESGQSNVGTGNALSPILSDFATMLMAVNDTQPPLKKFTVAPWEGTADQIGEEPAVEGEVTLVLLDRDEMMASYPGLQERGVLCVEMKYMNCPTEDGLRNDIKLPFVDAETRISFLPASRIQWVYDYYRQITNFFGLPAMEEATTHLDNMSAPFVICIVNGTFAG